MAIAHIAFDFGAWHEGRNRIDNEHVDGARTNESFDDFERLFASVWLRDQHVCSVNAEFACVTDIERVLGIDERDDAAFFLGFERSSSERELFYPKISGP